MASALPDSAPDLADKPLLAVLKGERRDPPPMWLMRQAGRYLPEYRALRARPRAASSTWPMIRRPRPRSRCSRSGASPFDGAILFSDILVVPHAMGMDLTFVAGEGPRLAPPLAGARIRDLKPQIERLDPIYETVRRVKAELSPQTTFLGFAGSPWTVATYMIAGQGSREQAEARQLAYSDPGKMDAILDIVVAHHGRLSVGPDRGGGRCGAIVRQLGGEPVAGPVRAAWSSPAPPGSSTSCSKRHPETPIIGFPKGAGGKLRAYAAETGVDAIGLDETVDPVWAAQRIARRACPCKAISTRWRWSPAARRCGPRRAESLTHSPTVPTSSTWAMGSSRRRRSRMSRSWSSLVKG